MSTAAPRSFTALAPSQQPHFSKCEDDHHRLVVPSGGTLPPICVITGEELPVANTSYELEYLNDLPGSNDPASKGIRNPAPVRLPLSASGRRVYHLSRKALYGLAVLAIISNLAVAYLAEGTWLWAGMLLWSFPLVFGGELLVACGFAFKAEPAAGGKIAIRGIRKSIRQRMLTWQTSHPELYPTHP